jgi:hypothetical protein
LVSLTIKANAITEEITCRLSRLKMKLQKKFFILLFCQSLVFAQELIEDRQDGEDREEPLKNFVFDLPDLVAHFEILGEEVQIEAFGLRKVRKLGAMEVSTIDTN